MTGRKSKLPVSRSWVFEYVNQSVWFVIQLGQNRKAYLFKRKYWVAIAELLSLGTFASNGFFSGIQWYRKHQRWSDNLFHQMCFSWTSRSLLILFHRCAGQMFNQFGSQFSLCSTYIQMSCDDFGRICPHLNNAFTKPSSLRNIDSKVHVPYLPKRVPTDVR